MTKNDFLRRDLLLNDILNELYFTKTETIYDST